MMFYWFYRYEETLWPKQLGLSHASQILTSAQIVRFWFFLSYLITTVSAITLTKPLPIVSKLTVKKTPF